MKIDEVKPGNDYAIGTFHGKANFNSDSLGKVRALEIVWVDDRVYSSTYGRLKDRKVRHVKVQYATGDVATVKAERLAGEWDVYVKQRDETRAKYETEEQRKDRIEAAFAKLGLNTTRIQRWGGDGTSVAITDETLDAWLAKQ